MKDSEASKVFSSVRVVSLFMPYQEFWVKEKFRAGGGKHVPVNFRMVDDRFLFHFGMFCHFVEQRLVLLNCNVLADEFTSTEKMFDAIGGANDENSFTTAPEAYALLLAHAEGKPNSALSITHGNLFFLQGRCERSWILNLSWFKDVGWIATFCEGLIPHNWSQGTRVFSRHKLKRVV